MSKRQVEIGLSKFNIRWIGDNKILVMIGARGRGKSTVLLDYLYNNRDIPFATCISPTDDLNNTYSPHIPSKFIFNKFTPELLANFVKRQKQIKKNKEKALVGMVDERYKHVDPRGILIMDDCLADSKQWNKDENIRWIFMNGRHAAITLVLTMQYQIGIPPELRVNIDWVFICKETKKMEKEKLWKYYAGIFPTYDMFSQIFDKCTQDKKVMVIDCLSESSKIEEQIYWYKADIHEDFRICYDEFWQNNEYYLKERLEESDPTHKNSVEAREDDYYKYVGGNAKNKIRFNLKMGQEYDPDEEDAM
jgi:hypothetical protein